MKEMQHYDKAAHNFYQKQHVNALPLNAWDVFATQFTTINEALSDVVKFKKLAEENKWDLNIPIEDEILNKNHVVIITDTSLNIIYSSKNIFKMNGYSSEEIIGEKPKMFQGELTCKETVKKIGKAVKDRVPFEITILNYRKDETTYNCWIRGAPIKDKNGNVVNFIAFEREVA